MFGSTIKQSSGPEKEISLILTTQRLLKQKRITGNESETMSLNFKKIYRRKMF
jgi:hypothetical protein